MGGRLGVLALAMGLAACAPRAAAPGGGPAPSAGDPRLAPPLTVTDEGLPSRTCVGLSPDGRAYWMKTYNALEPPAKHRWISLVETRLSDERLLSEHPIADEIDDPNRDAFRLAPGAPDADARAARKLRDHLPVIAEIIAREGLRACLPGEGTVLGVTLQGPSGPVTLRVADDGSALERVRGDEIVRTSGLLCTVDAAGDCAGPGEVIQGAWSADGVGYALVLIGATDVTPTPRGVALP